MGSDGSGSNVHGNWVQYGLKGWEENFKKTGKNHEVLEIEMHYNYSGTFENI